MIDQSDFHAVGIYVYSLSSSLACVFVPILVRSQCSPIVSLSFYGTSSFLRYIDIGKYLLKIKTELTICTP